MSDQTQVVNTESGQSGATPPTLDDFKGQFPAFTDQIMNLVGQIRRVDDKVTALLSIGAGFVLFILSIIMKYQIPSLAPSEFITLIIASTLLMLGGALLRMYQTTMWHGIIAEQQFAGATLLNKQIDTAKEMYINSHQSQRRGVIIFQSKLRKPMRLAYLPSQSINSALPLNSVELRTLPHGKGTETIVQTTQ